MMSKIINLKGFCIHNYNTKKQRLKFGTGNPRGMKKAS